MTGPDRPSEHFAWSEFEVTSTGLPNELTPNARKWLRQLATQILEPAREAFGAIRVNSAFRSDAVNQAVSGATGSQHRAIGDGAAVDIQPVTGDRYELATWLYHHRNELPLGQVIVYRDRSHVHVSIEAEPRGQFLEHDAGKYTTWTPA